MSSALEELIKKSGARLVNIDSLVDVIPGADENSVKDMQPLFTNLRGIADRTQAVIILIHHSNRNGGYRGSSALKGAVDVLLKVTSTPGEKMIQFEVEKNRDGEPIKFTAEAHFEEGKFWLSQSAYIPAGGLKLSQTEWQLSSTSPRMGLATIRE